MKTKKQFTNRILSLVLALVMVLGTVPNLVLKADAANDEYTATYTQESSGHTYTFKLTRLDRNNNGETFYYYGNVKSVYINQATPIEDFIRIEFGIKFNYMANDRIIYTYYDVTPGECDKEINLTFAEPCYGGDGKSPTVPSSTFTATFQVKRSAYSHQSDVTCLNAAECIVCGATYTKSHAPAATWTTENGKHYHICNNGCGIKLDEGTCSYSPATCLAASVCSVCKYEYAAQLDHSYTYTADGNTITETCDNGCGHTATATLTATDVTYAGSPITTGAYVIYSDGWAGSQEHGEITYSNNLNVGDATAKVTVEGKVLTTAFKINAAKISGAAVTLNPTSGTYTGTAYNPSVSVTLDGFGTLVEGADYTLSWNKTGFTNADTYTVTVTGEGNFEGTTERTFTINAANLADVKVEQVGTLTYTGEALTPAVSANAVAVNNQPITFTYSTESEGPYSTEIPSFTNAGWAHTVYYRATADNHNTYYGSFLVEIEKATVIEPTIATKPYTGFEQTADVTDTDLYTVVKNEGGTGVKENGYYDVVLELKDSANYKWSTTDNAQVTLQFKITRAENEWTVDPSITGWTYGEAAKAPVGEAKFGEVSVGYSGTTNGGAAYNGVAAPTEAGSYTATFIVQGTEDYKGLETSVDFTIAKADYNMRGAKWNYREPFKYDGKEHKVEVVGLPTGVTVESYENNTATAVGDYYAEVNLTYDAHNYNAPTISKLGWTIYNDWSPTEYTATTPNGNGWLNSDFVITARDGHKVSLANTADGDWKDALTYSGETADGSVTFCLKNETDGTISLAKTVTYKLDKTAPTGKVAFVNRNAWEEFVNTITFGLFFKDEVTVKATANDTLSGVDKIEYASADKAMTLDEVKAITDWTEYTDSFGVTLEDAKTFVYFVRITDKAGNVTYLSTDGAEYDTTVPVISGIEDGKTYYTTQKVTVTEKNVDTITLNGNPATENITLAGNKEATYTIVVTDKAGNTTTVAVTMKPIKELAKATENLGNDNVTSDAAPALKELVEKLGELIADPDTSDDGERETLEQHKAIAESLLKTIEDAAKAADTENTGKVQDITAEKVTPEDKTDLEKAKTDLEKALEDNSGNYTEDEKKAIADEIKRIDDALTVVENVKVVEETVSKLPAVDTVKPDDEEAIKAITDAQTAYNALSDYEKSLVDEAAKENLDKLVAALVAYDIVEGDGSSWTEDSDHNITFVVNGLFGKFVGIKVDGKDVDKANYEVKAGSTIITLKASYLDTLAVGEHTITVVYTDGSTDGAFNVHAKANSPATGDNSNMFLWIALLFISGGAVITLTVVDRKRRMASKR